jgi:malate dehydrogenase
MAEAILKDKNKILPCCVYAEGEYGIDGTFVGLPVKLGRNGIEEIIQVKLTDKEQEELRISASHVSELCTRVHELGIL